MEARGAGQIETVSHNICSLESSISKIYCPFIRLLEKHLPSLPKLAACLIQGLEPKI